LEHQLKTLDKLKKDIHYSTENAPPDLISNAAHELLIKQESDVDNLKKDVQSLIDSKYKNFGSKYRKIEKGKKDIENYCRGINCINKL